MAELADALDLGSSGATRTGSIPARCTKQFIPSLLGQELARYKGFFLEDKDRNKIKYTHKCLYLSI